MPDISLMDVTTVDAKDIYDLLSSTGWLDSDAATSIVVKVDN
jgi:hypothetical protein